MASVVSRSGLRAAGMSDSAIGRAAARGALVRVARGLYQTAAPEAADPAVATWSGADVVAALQSGIVLADLSAAAAWGLPTPDVPDVHVQVPHGRHHRALPSGFVVHQTRVSAVTELDGVPVTTAARTVVDVARRHEAGVAVPILDEALHRGLVSHQELSDELRTRAAGNVRARRAVALADGRAESPLESLLRLALVLGGVPPADVQHDVREGGRFVGRVDLWYPGVVVEADGFAFHRGREDYRSDRRKGQAYARLGLLVLRFTWEDVVGAPDAVVASVKAALAAAGRSVSASGQA